MSKLVWPIVLGVVLVGFPLIAWNAGVRIDRTDLILAAVFVIILVLAQGQLTLQAQNRLFQTQVQAKLDCLLAQAGARYDPWSAIRLAARNGDTIAAIRLCRDLTGLSLRDAKRRVEELAAEAE